jgi:hypothetical protein
MDTIEEFEAAAILNFEVFITDLMTNGLPSGLVAADRETAIGWVTESFDVSGDRELLCFHLGLPYRYLKNEQVQVH